MKKAVIYIYLGFFLIMCLAPFLISLYDDYSYVLDDINLNPNDYARITDVEYSAVVVDEPGSKGKVVVTERLTYDIHAASQNNLYWELWRDLPEDEIDGVKLEYKVLSVKQILPDGTEILYKESPKLYWEDEDYVSSNTRYGPGKWYHSDGPYSEYNRQYECVFFYVDGLYREEVVFEIEYEMYNATLRYNDCSDLYLCFYSGNSIKYLESYKAEILLPNEDMPDSGNYDVFTYGTNSNDFPVTESATENPGYYTFTIDLDEEDLQFKPYNQYIEFELVAYGEDKHIFTEYTPSNRYSNDNVLDEIYEEHEEFALAPARFQKAKNSLLVIMSVVAILVLVYTFTTGKRMNSKHIFYSSDTETEYYYREIPSDLDPNFAAALVHCKSKPPKDDSCIYSAILLSLARKKYIEFYEYSTNDTQIILQRSSTELREPLTLCEEYYFNLLVRHAPSGSITMSYFQQSISTDYQNTKSFANNMKKSIVDIGVSNRFFQKADYDEPKKHMLSKAKFFMGMGIILLTIVNLISYHTRMDLAFGAYTILGIAFIVSSIYLKIHSRKYVLLTQYGEEEYAKWRGLYNFLSSDTRINESTYIDLPIWEKYLVYATAFGLSEKVISALSIKCPKETSSPVFTTTYYHSPRRFHHHSGRSFSSAVRRGSRGSFRSGGFGGYGSGGRGGGGGGGGGGH